MDGEERIKKAYQAILCSDFELAIALFEEAVQLEPDNASYYYKLSITCARSNRLTKAVEHARAAVRLSPEEPSYQLHLHRLQAKERILQAQIAMAKDVNQLYMAAALLKEAARLDPLSVEAYLLLGVAYAAMDEYPEALQAMKEVLKLNPQHSGAAALELDYTNKVSQMLSGGKEK